MIAAAQLFQDTSDQLAEQLGLFHARLPRKPYCSDDLQYGLTIRPRDQAIRNRYIQPNSPAALNVLCFDVDRNGAAIDWSDRGAPPPSLTVKNPNNGHAHLLYALQTPVTQRSATVFGRDKPLRFAAAVTCALTDKLGADPSYSGLIVKNPLHSHWQTHSWEGAWTLPELDSWLDLSPYKDNRKKFPCVAYGRNCNLFEMLRRWAYKAIRQGWPSLSEFMLACEHRAIGYNIQNHTENPLDAAEVRHIAKSVAKWVHRNMSATSFAEYVRRTHTPEIQAARGKRKGKAKREECLPKVRELRELGWSRRKIAEETGVPYRTVADWLKRSESVCADTYIR